MTLFVKLTGLSLLFVSYISFAKEGTTPAPAVVFKENKGQLKDQHEEPRNDIHFYGSTQGLSYYLKSTGLSYQLYKQHGSGPTPSVEPFDKTQERKSDSVTIQRIDISWAGANPNAKIITTAPVAGVEHYYTSATPITDVKSYGSITYKNIYPSIDLKYYSKEGSLKYDYVVKPGADYRNIKLRIEGATSIEKNKDGSITIHTPLGGIQEGEPKVLQENRVIEASWVLAADVISLDIGEFDPAKPLIIDPLVFQTGFATQQATPFSYYQGREVSIDKNGNPFWCGIEAYQSFSNPAAFLKRPGFSLSYPIAAPWTISIGHACAADDSGNIFLAGSTESSSGIATTGVYQTTLSGLKDGFVLKVSSSGTTLWATYFGGPANDDIYSCATDKNGNLYAAGSTSSSSDIASPNAHQTSSGGAADGFLVKFSPEGQRVWATYYGGNGNDVINRCVVKKEGYVVFCGSTNSSTAISTQASYQSNLQGSDNAFLAAMDTNGVRLWATYFGGTSTFGEDCAIDSAGSIYLCGISTATGLGTTGTYQAAPGGGTDGYLARFDNTGMPVWCTYVGGSEYDVAYGCSVNNLGKVYVSGITQSATNIATADGWHNTLGTYNQGFYKDNAFLIEFDTSGHRWWGTYYFPVGGFQPKVWGRIRCNSDDNGNVYLCGSQLVTSNGGGNGFLFKFSSVPSNVETLLAAEDKVKIIPNPTKGMIRVVGEVPAKIKVVNVLGQVVLEVSNQATVSLYHLFNGAYMVNLYDESGRLYHTEKIIKN
jgi:hypothetical protein